MSPTDEMNPYAPSSHAADPALAERPAIGGRVSSTSLCLWTMGACTVAGGLFGLATLIFLVASSLLFDADRANMARLVDITIFAGYGIVVGGVLAFVSSIPSVMLAFVVGMPWRKADHQWDSKAIGRFAAVSGLLAGFLPLPVASGLDPSAFVFALLPAIFGSITARLLIIPLARKARERPEPLSSQLPGNYAGG